MMGVSIFSILVLVLGGLLVLGAIAAIGRLKLPTLGHTTLNCPHCRGETPAERPNCQHCGERL